MEECIFFPSPNWFQSSGLCVTRDGWLIYGGPNSSLCVIEPLPTNTTGVVEGERYRAHFLYKAHPEKYLKKTANNNRRVVSVDITPEWPEKKLILSGSSDGTVKQWILEPTNNKYRFRSTHSHDVHKNNDEEVVGVGYSKKSCALSVGNFGNIAKWDLNSNVVKTYKTFLKGFKPTCVSCSPHILLNVAVGTRQGVLFVLDLNGEGKILYKVRCQDDEVVNISWCPQYEVPLKRSVKEPEKRVSANERMAKIRHEAKTNSENHNQSFATKNLPDDSFDESIIEEDDTFDIYTDHDMDLFGPNKYQPKNVVVKVKKEVPVDNNYLAECLKLREEIVKGKSENQADMASLVDAMEKTHVENEQKKYANDASQVDSNIAESSNINEIANLVQALETKYVDNKENEHADDSIDKGSNVNENVNLPQSSEKGHVENGQKEHLDVASEGFHVHKHIIATIGKLGAVCIWSISGKQIGFCNILNSGNKKQRTKQPIYKTLYWHMVDCLMIGNGQSELLQCNPLKVDSKNRMEYHVVHSLHKRGLFCIASDAPKVQIPVDKNITSIPNNWSVWTFAQDRSMIKYSLESNKTMFMSESCGGYVYMIQPCPYDAKKIAVAVGDGAVRIWEADTTDEDDTKLCRGTVTAHWQNVQGKVLSLAWHPTREHVLAFATAENRVGLIDTSGKGDRPAKPLISHLTNGVYSLCWGEGDKLYACGGKTMVAYNAFRVDEQPETVSISLEGHQWAIACVRRFVRGLLAVGSATGAVAIVDDKSYTVLAANYVFTSMLFNVECHPQQTSESDDKSPYRNLIAVTASSDKENSIAILEYVDKEDGTKQLQKWKVLLGHKNTIHQLAWNPHRDELLVSTSLDSTVRVWDIMQGVCLSIFGGHSRGSVGVAWGARPQMYDVLMSGGMDCALRLWRYQDHPAETFTGTENVTMTRKEKKKVMNVPPKKEKKANEPKIEQVGQADVGQAHVPVVEKVKMSKKYLFPLITKQIVNCGLKGARKMLQNYVDSNAQCINGKIENPIFNIEQNINIEADIETKDDKESSDNKDTSPLNKDLYTEIMDKHSPTEVMDKDSPTDVMDKDSPTEVMDKDSPTDVMDKDSPTEVMDKDSSTEVMDKNLSTENKDEHTVEDRNEDKPAEDEKPIDEREYGIDFIKMFGNTNDVNDILNLEMIHHLEKGNFDAWIVLCIIRGHIDTMMQFASAKDILCPYLISIAPCVSFKYWKDATQLYLAQIDRVVAKGEEEKLYMFKNYGGAVYRKVGLLLSIHDIKRAVETFIDAGLYKEAYILCRTRHMDSIAQETLEKWSKKCASSGNLILSAICNLAIGELSKAVATLSKAKTPEHLSLAADIAKVAGYVTYAHQIKERSSNLQLKETVAENEDALGELPTRMELLLRNKTTENEAVDKPSLNENDYEEAMDEPSFKIENDKY